MTYDEITLFGRFLQDKSMQKNFAYFYENHRFDRRSLDTFLEQVDAEDAILSAFDLAGAPNSIFNPKYWQGLNEKWMKRLKNFRDGGSNLEADLVRCDHCGRMMPRSSFALNVRGQLHKYCRECESGEWDRRRKEEEAKAKEQEKQEKAMRQLEKEIAEKKAKLERLTAERHAKAETEADQTGAGPILPLSRGSQRGADPLQNTLAQTTPNPSYSGGEDTALENGATSGGEDEAEVKTAPKLGEYDATMHYKANEKRIVFNGVLSAHIKAAGMTKCYLSTERDGSQFLVFNDAEGANVTWAGSKTSVLAQVCSSSTCRQIAEKYRLAVGDLYYLHITKNLSHQKDIINVEVKQVRSREEYAAIAARREEKARQVPGRDVPEYERPDEEETVDTPLIDFSGELEQMESKPKALAKDKYEPIITTPKNLRVMPAVNDTSQSLMIPLSGRKPADILQQLVDRNHLTEHDIARFLYNRGWKLQEPVVVTTHKKFKA